MSQDSEPKPGKRPPRAAAEAVRDAVRRILWSLQKVANASLPSALDEPAEVFGRRLEEWDKLCKSALAAEGFLGQGKEERALEFLERSARELEKLGEPATAPELAELAASVENAAKVWDRTARAAARDAGEAAWLELAFGLALDALAARTSALADDDRKRILDGRVAELRAHRERMGEFSPAASRPLRRKRLAALLRRRTRRLRAEFRAKESEAAALADEAEGRAGDGELRARNAESRAQDAEAAAAGLRRDLESARADGERFLREKAELERTIETLRENFEQETLRARAATERAAAGETEALHLREKGAELGRKLSELEKRVMTPDLEQGAAGSRMKEDVQASRS